jgi:hypothetical protein
MDAGRVSGMLPKITDFVREIPDKSVQVPYMWGGCAQNKNAY